MSDDEEFESDDEYFDEIQVDMRDNDGSRWELNSLTISIIIAINLVII